MMLSWHYSIVSAVQLFIYLSILLTTTEANIIQTVLGLPSECVHQNTVRSCKLSFSCWLQGGRHTHGCGDNRWLFSCCIGENEVHPVAQSTIPEYALILPNPNYNLKWINSIRSHEVKAEKYKPLPNQVVKKNVLRRRADEDFQQFDCGLPRTATNTIQKRIIGGRPAAFAEYPWQAHIRISEFQCGGVLVSRYFVATAAHCIQQARTKDIVIYLGELDTQNSGSVLEPIAAEKFRVVRKIVHPRFNFRMTQPDRYDLALLKLSRPANFKNHILPICLPMQPMDLTGKKGIIAGWGKTEPNMGHTGTNILQTAFVPILSTKECIRWHQTKQINVELYNEMFCAGHSDGHQDACLGDSGGPLIVMDKGRFTLVGITSAGFGCGVDHQPGIYHNVQKTSKWIQDIIHHAF